MAANAIIPEMADSAWVPNLAAAVTSAKGTPRDTALVRVTHWITALCFAALLVSGFEILISHPRFYWGEAGNILTPPLFSLPIPASRSSVPTGYGFVLPDQNGWSRYLHFQAAWVAVLTGFLYAISSLFTGLGVAGRGLLLVRWHLKAQSILRHEGIRT